MRRKRFGYIKSASEAIKIAEVAKREAVTAKRKENTLAARQAVEKAYLAMVESARHIIECAGEDVPEKSSTAIGEASRLLGEAKLKDRNTKKITRAMSETLGQHKACFYDGVCNFDTALNAAKSAVAAAKALKDVCYRVQKHPRDRAR